MVRRSTVLIGAEGVALRHHILLLMTRDTKFAESSNARLVYAILSWLGGSVIYTAS